MRLKGLRREGPKGVRAVRLHHSLRMLKAAHLLPPLPPPFLFPLRSRACSLWPSSSSSSTIAITTSSCTALAWGSRRQEAGAAAKERKPAAPRALLDLLPVLAVSPAPTPHAHTHVHL